MKSKHLFKVQSMPAAKQKMAEEAFLELGTVAENGKRPKTEIGKEVIIK